MEKYKLVLIEWIDSKSGAGEWEFIEDLEPLTPALCTSVGFLIDKTDQYKTIVQTTSNDQIINRITIPCCSILSIKEIELIG